MMINARLALLVLSPLLLLGATCVTKVEQKGPKGPWVGEVVNTGPDAVHDVFVDADVVDASGNPVAGLSVPTCPSTLLPGQRGTFEIFFPADFPLPVDLPLRAIVDPVKDSQPGLGTVGEGLSVRLVGQNANRNAILAEVRNDSASIYRGVSVCANLRTPGGKLAEVGNAVLFPAVLRPGEARVFPMVFNSMPYGYYEFFPSGVSSCCGNDVVLDPALFRVSATRVVEGTDGGELQVVGEIRNTAGQDLGGVTLQAHLAGDPIDRIEAVVGCNGSVGYGSTAPVMFTLPLLSGSDIRNRPSVVVVGIQGGGDTDLIPIPVSNVSWQRIISARTARVTATLTNPSDTWFGLHGVCLNLRSADGALVGTLSYEDGGYLAPGGVMSLSGEVIEVGKAASAEVVAYGYPMTGSPIIIGPIS